MNMSTYVTSRVAEVKESKSGAILLFQRRRSMRRDLNDQEDLSCRQLSHQARLVKDRAENLES